MRGTVAKRLRREVYGKDESPRFREYRQATRWTTIAADTQRRYYQQLKREHYKEAK